MPRLKGSTDLKQRKTRDGSARANQHAAGPEGRTVPVSIHGYLTPESSAVLEAAPGKTGPQKLEACLVHLRAWEQLTDVV